ncbi:hypothetical protein FTW19_06330 [Terriglobus albidus]|uniref:Zf-HC2 domain-containing protein n=1 Tax=Terriglobus albidus TaxID=1592106 RepID=A0A5B9ECA2_9BACT|nr:hypothetical protein [Terriglobus albidus]QEE27646.1 hypothetical protein FTW19_06330 [Terriglobus albidus]
MTGTHKEFEKLCALAAVEQLSEMDRRDLKNHCLYCEGCRRCLIEAEAVSQEYFFLFAARSEKTATLPSGAHDRFLRRASALGIPLSHASSRNLTNRLVLLPIGAFAIAVVTLFLCRALITSRDIPHDMQANNLSSTRQISQAPLDLTRARTPASVVASSPSKRRHTTERLTLQVSHVRYRTQFQFSPQLNLMDGITTSKEPLVFKLSHPANWDTLHPITIKTFALTSLPQLWADDDPSSSRDKHIAHFDLPALFPKSNGKTQ